MASPSRKSQNTTAQDASVPDTYAPESLQKSILDETIVDPAKVENLEKVGLKPKILEILGADSSKPKNAGIIL